MVSSLKRGQIIKTKLILDSPNLLLQNKIKIFILEIHRTSYGHLKQWYKMDKFDLSGIATQNWHKNVKFDPKLDLLRLFWRYLLAKLDFKLRNRQKWAFHIFVDQKHYFSKWPFLGLIKKQFLDFFYEKISHKYF